MVVFQADPCGIICLLVTYGALGYADYVIIRHLVIPTLSDTLWGAFCVLVFNCIVFLLAVAHLRAVFSDPGVVPLPKTNLDFSDLHTAGAQQKQKEKANGWTVCMKCETYRPPRAYHCRTCGRCIKRMDHHCPWINNCVGELNQKYFIQFLFYVGMASLFSIFMVALVWVLDPEAKLHSSKHTRVIHSIALVVESILFGLFVIAIGCDQIQAILSDETAVEYVKKAGPYRNNNKSNMALLAEVFGRGPKLFWMCPIEVTSPKSLEQYTDYTV